MNAGGGGGFEYEYEREWESDEDYEYDEDDERRARLGAAVILSGSYVESVAPAAALAPVRGTNPAGSVFSHDRSLFVVADEGPLDGGGKIPELAGCRAGGLRLLGECRAHSGGGSEDDS